MSRPIVCLAAAAALLSAGAAVAQSLPPSAPPGTPDGGRPSLPVTAFDARAVQSPVERLVLCDATDFVLSRPQLRSREIVVRRSRQGRFETLLPPYFVQGGAWYNEGYDLAWRRLSAGEKAGTPVAETQERLARPLIAGFNRPRPDDRRFLEGQRDWCRAQVGPSASF